jgi:sugar O-acyltransferase (sialic acid O-acetyltransferase NeuD family)
VATITETLLIWGAGGHGLMVADVAQAAGWRVSGFADRDPRLRGTEVGGLRVLCSDSELIDGATSVAFGIGDNAARLRSVDAVADERCPSLVHPSAVVSGSAVLGHGTAVLPLAAVNAGARIARGCIVNTSAVIEHECRLGAGVHVSPGAVLAGRVTVGDRSWIGAGAVVIQGIRIGSDCIVGAGAVVIRDVADGETVVGNPARRIHPQG